jgi:hypothetical protein
MTISHNQSRQKPGVVEYSAFHRVCRKCAERTPVSHFPDKQQLFFLLILDLNIEFCCLRTLTEPNPVRASVSGMCQRLIAAHSRREATRAATARRYSKSTRKAAAAAAPGRVDEEAEEGKEGEEGDAEDLDDDNAVAKIASEEEASDDGGNEDVDNDPAAAADAEAEADKGDIETSADDAADTGGREDARRSCATRLRAAIRASGGVGKQAAGVGRNGSTHSLSSCCFCERVSFRRTRACVRVRVGIVFRMRQDISSRNESMRKKAQCHQMQTNKMRKTIEKEKAEASKQPPQQR